MRKTQIDISDEKFAALLTARNSDKSEIHEISGAMGEREKDAVENNHLHSGAFKLVAKLVKMDELKRQDYLRSFTVYVDKARRTGLMGAEHAGDLAERAEDEKTAEEATTLTLKQLKPRKPKGDGLDGADATGTTRIQ